MVKRPINVVKCEIQKAFKDNFVRAEINTQLNWNKFRRYINKKKSSNSISTSRLYSDHHSGNLYDTSNFINFNFLRQVELNFHMIKLLSHQETFESEISFLSCII